MFVLDTDLYIYKMLIINIIFEFVVACSYLIENVPKKNVTSRMNLQVIELEL